MVATLLRLRFRVLGNQLARHPGQLVGFVIGALYGAVLLVGVVVGLVVLGFGELTTAALVITGVGCLITLGWVVGPLLAFGVDATLDPERLVVFPMSRRRMMIALGLAGITGVPGIITSLAALATVFTWVHWPGALPAWLICAPLAAATAVVASRAVAALAARMSGGRRLREASGILIFIPLILAGPLLAGLTAGFALNLDSLRGVVRVLAWTPLGAAWAAPSDAAAGDWPTALGRLAIAVGTLAALWALWQWSLGRALVRPRQSTGGSLAAGRIGWFGRVPTGAAGAIFARALTYWIRDPRYLRQLVVVPLVAAMLWLWMRDGDIAVAFGFAAPLIALFLGMVSYADVSYDGTAFGLQLAAGATGRADRAGRALAAGAVAMPALLVGTALPLALSGDAAQGFGIFGMSAGILLTCYGVCAVTSALLVVPVPGSDDNPFTRVPGTTFVQILVFFGISLGALVLSSPTIVVGSIAILNRDAALGAVGGLVGIVMGAGILAAGIVAGGRTLDRTGPMLFSRLRAMKNA